MNTTPSNLPRRLAISFPIWGIFDMPPGGAYHDVDRMMRETAERGYNCIRLEDGAGLIDFSGPTPNGRIRVQEPFRGFCGSIRQLWVMGGEGECDLVERLLAIAEAADRHGIYLILSSWYYLHTNWYFDNPAKNREYFSLSDPERFAFFARQLDCILALLRSHGLLHRVAYAEVQNEIDGAGIFFGTIDGKDGRKRTPEEAAAFKAAHAEALDWLRKRNPDVLFAVDTCTPWTPPELFPANPQVWNFHSYFMWDLYGLFERNLLNPATNVDDPAELGETAQYLKADRGPLSAVYDSRKGLVPAMYGCGWYNRVWLYGNIDPAKLPALNKRLSDELDKKVDFYRQKIVDMLDAACAFRDAHCPGVPLVMGEGVTYETHQLLDWEENSDTYWDLIEFAVGEYRRHGLWGAVLRTCSSVEDICWNRCAERLLKLNRMLLAD